jgi:cytoskeletal protein CcmA (bactofilin family)
VEVTARIIDETTEHSFIAKGLILKGEITGSGSLVIDGSVEGSINLCESRVTAGYSSLITADIIARDIVVMGKVQGNFTALNRIDILDQSSMTGKAVAARLTIADGACFKGSIEILGHAPQLEAEAVLPKAASEHSKAFLVEKPGVEELILRPASMSA